MSIGWDGSPRTPGVHPLHHVNHHRSRGTAVAVLIALGSLLVACGSDDASSSDTTSRESSYEEIPMSEVLEGLPAMLAAADEAQAAADADDFDGVLASYDDLHEVWEEVEGTVKATDRDLYEQIESAQSLIKDGGESADTSRVTTGVQQQADAVATFVDENG